MDAPLLQDCLPVRIGMDRAGVGMATRYLSATYFLLPVRGSHGTGDDMIGVSGVYYGVTIAVETMVGTGGRSPGTAEVSPGAEELREPPCRIAANAEIRSSAAPQARPECTAIAA